MFLSANRRSIPDQVRDRLRRNMRWLKVLDREAQGGQGDRKAVIARRAKPDEAISATRAYAQVKRDCFASLAMTNLGKSCASGGNHEQCQTLGPVAGGPVDPCRPHRH